MTDDIDRNNLLESHWPSTPQLHIVNDDKNKQLDVVIRYVKTHEVKDFLFNTHDNCRE